MIARVTRFPHQVSGVGWANRMPMLRLKAGDACQWADLGNLEAPRSRSTPILLTGACAGDSEFMPLAACLCRGSDRLALPPY